MMTAMLVLVIPFLRSAFLRLIPAIIQSLLVSLLLIAGIVWVKSRTLLADVIKGALGTVCNVGVASAASSRVRARAAVACVDMWNATPSRVLAVPILESGTHTDCIATPYPALNIEPAEYAGTAKLGTEMEHAGTTEPGTDGEDAVH
eukprot:3442314-Rhodomonas_salina.1